MTVTALTGASRQNCKWGRRKWFCGSEGGAGSVHLTPRDKIRLSAPSLYVATPSWTGAPLILSPSRRCSGPRAIGVRSHQPGKTPPDSLFSSLLVPSFEEHPQPQRPCAGIWGSQISAASKPKIMSQEVTVADTSDNITTGNLGSDLPEDSETLKFLISK